LRETFANNYGIDTGSGERQTGRKAQLSNIAAAKTYEKNITFVIRGADIQLTRFF
jgi:hypothetical protein